MLNNFDFFGIFIAIIAAVFIGVTGDGNWFWWGLAVLVMISGAVVLIQHEAETLGTHRIRDGPD